MTANFADNPSTLHAALSNRQAFALIEEAESARNLMRDSIAAISSMRFVRTHGDSVFTMGSIGTEKVMKIMLGCAVLERTGRWPSIDELKGLGHDVETLSGLVAAAVDSGLVATTAPGYAAQLAGRLRESTILPSLFAAFARYGKSGRFHHLDILATDKPGTHEHPSKYWDRLESHVNVIWDQFRPVPADDMRAIFDKDARRREYIAGELDCWWYCLHRLGMQRCFGELGRAVGLEIWDPGRPEPMLLLASPES